MANPLPPLALLALLSCGCAPATALRAAPSAQDPPGPGSVAVGEAAGVRLEVRPEIEHPRELRQPVVPLFVAIENRSGYDVIVRPGAFHLVSPTGMRREAIPPDRLRLPDTSSVSADIALSMRALPPDVLGSGGRMDGFLYFDETERAGPATLTFDVRAQDDNALIGLIAVPLVRD